MAQTYTQRKAAARNEAMGFQDECANRSMSYGELAEYMERFETLGRRYGLTQEFRENCII